MKIYIGPYVNRFNSDIYSRYMIKKYGYDWLDNQNKFENFLEKLEDGLQWVYNKTINKYLDKKERKIHVKIHSYDTFSMDDTLTHIILPMLKQLNDTKHGAPFVDDSDVPEELKSTSAPPKENDWDTDDNHFKRWDYALGEMIWAFEQKKRDWWQEDYIIEHAEMDLENTEKKENGYYELKWKNHGVYDREGEKKHQERMSNGFRLFGKYYEELWN